MASEQMKNVTYDTSGKVSMQRGSNTGLRDTLAHNFNFSISPHYLTVFTEWPKNGTVFCAP